MTPAEIAAALDELTAAGDPVRLVTALDKLEEGGPALAPHLPRLAEAFLTTLTQRLRPPFPTVGRPAALPPSLDGLSAVLTDGRNAERSGILGVPDRSAQRVMACQLMSR